MAREKSPRKKMLKEPDGFIHTTGTLLQWARGHDRWIAAGALAAVLLGLAAWGWRGHTARVERRAQGLLAQAYQVYRNAMEQTDEATSRELMSKAVDRFQEVIQRFEGTQAAWTARVYKGHADYALGRYGEAVQDYERAFQEAPSEEVKPLALQGLGYAWLGRGDLNRAAEVFERLRDQGGSGFERMAQWNLARCYELQGKTAEAMEIYRQLESSFPDPIHRMLAQAKLTALAAEGGAAP